MEMTDEEKETAIRSCVELSDRDPQFEIAEYLLQQGFDWIEMIKAYRRLTGASLDSANRAALAVAGWRRWCARRVRIDRHCEKLARHYVKAHPDDEFVRVVDGRVVFRGEPDRSDRAT